MVANDAFALARLIRGPTAVNMWTLLVTRRLHPEVRRLRTLTQKKVLRARKRRFLKKLAECGQYHLACELSGVGKGQMKRWRRNPRFEELCQEAKLEAIEKLEAEADRRGYHGYPQKVFFEGVHVGDITRYSDALLMMRLRALAPEKYSKQVTTTKRSGVIVFEPNLQTPCKREADEPSSD